MDPRTDEEPAASMLANYARRIGLAPSEIRNSRTISAEDALNQLRRVQVAHFYSVPFENLSMHAGEKVKMDLHSTFTKIVHNKRGGFCYEQNLLFHWLLEALEYDVMVMSSEVWRPSSSMFTAPFAHSALLVSLAEIQYLVDVGYPRAAGEPLLVEDKLEQRTDAGLFRISNLPNESDSAGSLSYVFEVFRKDEWFREYRFSTMPRKWEEFDQMLEWTQTSPESLFTCGRIVSMLRRGPGGEVRRTTLADRKLVITYPDGAREERVLDAGKAYSNALLEYFGVSMDDIAIPFAENPLHGSGKLEGIA